MSFKPHFRAKFQVNVINHSRVPFCEDYPSLDGSQAFCYQIVAQCDITDGVDEMFANEPTTEEYISLNKNRHTFKVKQNF